MSLENEKQQVTAQVEPLPPMLNLLTILTLVGCCLGLIRTGWVFWNAKQNYENALRLQIPGGFYVSGARQLGVEIVEAARRSYQYRTPILLFALTGIVLCVFGAMQMRNLRRRGFAIWVIGELLPVLSTFIFVGGRSMNAISVFLTLLVPAIFFILYAGQRRYLTK